MRRHEDLDRRYTLPGEARKLRLYVVAEVRDRRVEPVIYERLVPGLLGPSLDRPGASTTLLLKGKVYDSRRPPATAAAVPVAQSSAVTVPPKGISIWV